MRPSEERLAAGPEPNRHERVLVVILRIGAIVTGSAFFTMFLPEATMASVHTSLGLGEFPASPLTGYLTRSLSAMYAFHGGFLLVLSFDIRRFRPVLFFVGWATAGLGVALTAIDWTAAMPIWWLLAEGPWVIAIGLVIVVLTRHVEPASG